MSNLSYISQNNGPWSTYLEQIERVTPYLEHLKDYVDTLKRPKRALIVDVPIVMDDGTSVISKAIAFNITYRVVQVRAVFVTIQM